MCFFSDFQDKWSIQCCKLLKCFSFHLKHKFGQNWDWFPLKKKKQLHDAPYGSIPVQTQPEMSRRMWEWCGLKNVCTQTKGIRPSWPDWIMGDVVRMLVSLSLYQPLTNLIIHALAAVWGRKGAFSGSTQELEGWAPDRKRKESWALKELQLLLFIMMLMCIFKMHVHASSIL